LRASASSRSAARRLLADVSSAKSSSSIGIAVVLRFLALATQLLQTEYDWSMNGANGVDETEVTLTPRGQAVLNAGPPVAIPEKRTAPIPGIGPCADSVSIIAPAADSGMIRRNPAPRGPH